jgi:hypothetical protein
MPQGKQPGDAVRAEPERVSRKKSGAAGKRRGIFLAGVAALVVLLFVFYRFWRASIPNEMAPGAAAAVRRALGSKGIDRIVQVISPGNRPSLVSAATHLASGTDHGHAYGLAFDLDIPAPKTADADVRALRLQGIAAWRRGRGAPGGAEGLMPHIHCVWPGAPTTNIQNCQQVSSFAHGYRGLVGIGVPHERWLDPSIRSDERMKVTAVYESVHGPGSLAAMPPYETLHRGRQ